MMTSIKSERKGEQYEKKLLVVLGTVMALSVGLAGCQSTGDDSTKAVSASQEKKPDVKLTFMTNVVGDQATALEDVIEGTSRCIYNPWMVSCQVQ